MPKIDLQEIQARIDKGLPQPNEQPPSVNHSDDPSHPIWELWQRMGEIYGHQWASQQGDEPNDTWSMGLADLTPEQYGHGLRSLLNRQDKWPPNLVEFRQLATGYDPQAWERRAQKVVNTNNLIENTTAKERRMAEGLENMRKLREDVGL